MTGTPVPVLYAMLAALYVLPFACVAVRKWWSE